MADYGLQVYNANGELMVDSLNTGFTIFSMGTSTFSGTYGLNSYVDIPVSPNIAVSDGPLVLINGVTNYGVCFGGYLQSNEYVYAIRLFGYPGESINWAIAVRANLNASAADTYGLITYNQAGVKVFDSRYRQVLIRQIIPFTITYSASSVTLNHNAITTPYYLLSAVSGSQWRNMGIAGMWNLGAGVNQRSTTQATVAMTLLTREAQNLGPYYGYYSFPNPQMLVVCEISL